MRIVGSHCFQHVPDQLRKKLDDIEIPLILIGYHSTRGYKLFDPVNCKVLNNIDVVVDQTTCRNWKKSKVFSQPIIGHVAVIIGQNYFFFYFF